MCECVCTHTHVCLLWGLQYVSFAYYKYYWYCLILLTRTPNMMLSKSGKSRLPCTVLDFRGKVFSLPLLRILVVEFLWMCFIRLRKLPSIPSLLIVFIVNGCWILHQLIWPNDIIALSSLPSWYCELYWLILFWIMNWALHFLW